MWQIEPKRETVVKYSVVVTLDLDEINKILVDPRDFQRELRTLRNSFAPRRATFANDGHAHGDPPNKKHSKKNGSASVKSQRCPKCKRVFTRLAKHTPYCQGPDPLASKTAAVSPDIE